jgi:hypothetical protein|uniref:Uncharacterized protein n=1 Tax=Zea mays TaxID=4577 RepID=A0A804N5U2_MAIZE
MPSDPSAPLPSLPSALSLSQASGSLPLATVPSMVPTTGYVPLGTSSVPLTLDSLAEVVREISRNMAVMQGNMIAMQENISSIHTYITGAQNPPQPSLPASTPMPLPPSPFAAAHRISPNIRHCRILHGRGCAWRTAALDEVAPITVASPVICAAAADLLYSGDHHVVGGAV